MWLCDVAGLCVLRSVCVCVCVCVCGELHDSFLPQGSMVIACIVPFQSLCKKMYICAICSVTLILRGELKKIKNNLIPDMWKLGWV